MRKMLFSISMCILFSGCATLSGQNLEKTVFKKQYYEIDYSTVDLSGKLIIEAIPPSQQFAVKFYSLKVGNHEPIEILKHSETTILLDPGEHSVTLYAIPATFKGVYGKSFGKPRTVTFILQELEEVIYQYTGPFFMTSDGELIRK